MKRSGAAPCQWSSPGSKKTRSPGRMTSIDAPRRCARPTPSVTKMVCPFGCACHAVRAPGEKWTLLALRREAADGAATVSIYTAPVNHSLGPLLVPMLFLVTCMFALLMAPPRDRPGPAGAPGDEGDTYQDDDNPAQRGRRDLPSQQP